MTDSLRPPWTIERQTPLSSTISWNLLKLMFIESVKLSNLILCCHPLLLPSIFPSIRVFSKELAPCIRWLKYWNFSFSISPSNDYSGLFAFRIDCFYLLAVQGTLQSVLQPTVWKHQFFGPWPSLWSSSHPYIYWRNQSLTMQTFVGKVMSLLFNMLSRFVIASKEQVSFNFRSAVTVHSGLGNQENKMSLFPLFPNIFAMKWWDWTPWFLFLECWVLNELFHSFFTLSSVQ